MPTEGQMSSQSVAEWIDMVDLEVTMEIWDIPTDEEEMWLDMLRSISGWEVTEIHKDERD